MEKEFLTIVHAVSKFRHYITRYKVFVHADHLAIRFLMNKPITNGGITKWLLLLQEFNITIMERPGKENQVVDFLSRLQTKTKDVLVYDDFPNEHLFAISIHVPWFADIANYLVSGRLLQHLSSREK